MAATRLRVTLVVEYEPNPFHYDDEDPKAMAKVDQDNWTADPMALLASFGDDEFTVTVEPV